MLLKVLLVVLLAGQCVGGSERTLYVSEVITNFCDMKDMMPAVSANNNSFCENGSCYDSFDHALANVKNNDVINITTNSILSFHNILTGLENVSIIGYNNPTVYCYNTSVIIGALQFNSCTNCLIRGITWSGCGGIIDYPVLEFYNSSNITIEGCIFRRSQGQVITLSHMVGDAAINNCDFLQNVYLGNHGGAVMNIGNQGNSQVKFTIENCNFTDNSGTESIINIGGQSNDESLGNISFYNSTFLNNKGPAIYLNHQDLYLYGEFHFNDNTAENGAGMFVTSNSHVYFDKDSSVEFHQNIVSNSGGAIYLSNNSIISLGQTSKFTNNQAGNDGGAITLHNNSLINSNFSVLFLNNNATHNGGAVFINHYCNVNFGQSSTFINNTAKNGGAMALYDNCDCVITDAGHSKATLRFEGNTASQYGGALHLSMCSQTGFIQNAEVIFDKNSVDSSYGSAIFSDYSNVSFGGNSMVAFHNNSPADGTLYSKNTSYVRHHANVTYNVNNNTAQWHYGDEYTESNDVIINADGVVRCTDYREYYICSNNSKMCSCKHIMDVTSYSKVTITDDLNISSPIILEGLDSVYLTGHNNATIHYKETGELKFVLCQNVKITDLTWNRPSENKPIPRVTFSDVSNIILRNCSFQYSMGQAISLLNVCKHVTISRCKFIHNSGDVLIYYLPDCTSDNTSMLTITNCHFSYNEYTEPGLIFLNSSKAKSDNVLLHDSEFSDNDGTCIYGTKQNISIDGTVTFKHNEAYSGAGIFITSNSTVTFCSNSNVTFTQNHVDANGGAISLSDSNTVFESYSHLRFSNNKAMLGGAVYSTSNSHIRVVFQSRVTFSENEASKHGGSLYSEARSYIKFEGSSVVTYTKNKALNGNGGAIYCDNSDILFQEMSHTTFNENEAIDGGGIYLSDQCNTTFINDCNVKFSNNNAKDYGGAIYGKFATEIGQSTTISFNSTNIVFENNKARIVGDSVYVSLPKECKSNCLDTSILGNINSIIEHIITPPNELKLYHPAECIDGEDNDGECKVYFIDNIMLGQEIPLDACMYDYYDKEADPAQFQVTGNSVDLMLGLNTTFISCNHTVPDITIIAKNDDPKLPQNYSMNITLFVNRFLESKGVSANLTVQLSKCQPGFYYDEKVCKCYEDNNDIVFCSGSSSTIKRGYWFGEVNNKSTVTFCPINYCNFSCCEAPNGYYHLSPIRVDQCRLYRNGAACGNCEEGYALPYDSADCVSADKCTTAYTTLVVILTVIYWVVLFVAVFAIMHFKVEIGHLYGLTYYYSIIDILLSQNLEFSNGLFTVVNVLSGIAKVTPQFLGRICLFKEMSGIDQQFIHYVHPIAFSLILVMISMLAKLSRRLTEFISKVIIPIICFLLLLSYTSIATTSLLLMRPLTFHNIDKVYTYLSPDFEYFHNRHLGYALLAIVSTIAIVIFLPLLLLSEPFLNCKINFIKIKPLLDQFQGCYKDKYRSFAAYYMICRLMIITLIIANSSNEDFVIQYSLISVCVIIALVHLMIRPYANLVLNLFDGVVLHILILVATLPFVRHYDNFGSDLVLALAYILVLLPLTIFIVMELLIHKENIMKMIQNVKSFKLNKDKSNNNNEIPLNEVNQDIGIIVDENMRRNALIVDV